METKVRDKVLSAAQKRMLRFGYRKVTMDEIAQDLVMSKNTIYKTFAGKKEIAQALVHDLEHRIDDQLAMVETNERDPLKVFSESVLVLRKELGPWFEHFFREIETELPTLWKEFTHYRGQRILKIHALVEQGVRKGIFRKIKGSIAVQAYLGSVKAVVHPRFLEQENLTFDQALDAVLDIWSNGIIKRTGK